MKLRSCCRKAELTALLRDSRWPLGADLELRAHVSACGHCSELVLVMTVFQQARREAAQAELDAPGTLWWRAQLLRRRKAIETATRPIMVAEIVGLVVVMAALALSGWRWFEANATPAWMLAMRDLLHPAALVAAIANASPLVLVTAALTISVLVAAFVLCLSAARDS